jgi:hypothetical protein
MLLLTHLYPWSRRPCTRLPLYRVPEHPFNVGIDCPPTSAHPRLLHRDIIVEAALSHFPQGFIWAASDAVLATLVAASTTTARAQFECVKTLLLDTNPPLEQYQHGGYCCSFCSRPCRIFLPVGAPLCRLMDAIDANPTKAPRAIMTLIDPLQSGGKGAADIVKASAKAAMPAAGGKTTCALTAEQMKALECVIGHSNQELSCKGSVFKKIVKQDFVVAAAARLGVIPPNAKNNDQLWNRVREFASSWSNRATKTSCTNFKPNPPPM